MKRVLVFICVFSLVSCGVVKMKNDNTVTVSGLGQVTCQPDKASVIVSVVTSDGVAKNAAEQNAKIITQVRDSLVAIGVDIADITTQNYHISRLDKYYNGESTPGNYQVRNSMKIVVFDMDLVGQVIDTAIQAGANELTSLNFSLKDTSDVLKQARLQAVNDARSRAELFATASGRKLGDVITITEVQGNYAMPQTMMTNSFAFESYDAVATPLQAGNIDVSASVNITYKLE